MAQEDKQASTPSTASSSPATPVTPTPDVVPIAINDTCPWSGKPVVSDSLTKYNNHTVGFCNTGCRDKFATAINHFDKCAQQQASSTSASSSASSPSPSSPATPDVAPPVVPAIGTKLFHAVFTDGTTTSLTLPSPLHWRIPPKDCKIDPIAGGLLVTPHGKRDYWANTYYKPTLLKHDGCFACIDITTTSDITMETSFKLEGKAQFDQGGLMLRVDDNHWIKTGIEMVDGAARASCVVTNRGWSDWSTQPWTKPAMAIRLIRIGESIVVEIKDDKNVWNFVRICHIDGAGASTGVQMGLFTCAPTADGLVATFNHLTLSYGSSFDHTA